MYFTSEFANNSSASFSSWESDVRTSASSFLSAPNASSVSSQQKAACRDRKSTRLNSSHSQISYAVFCLKKKNAISDDNFPPHLSTSGIIEFRMQPPALDSEAPAAILTHCENRLREELACLTIDDLTSVA